MTECDGVEPVYSAVRWRRVAPAPLSAANRDGLGLSQQGSGKYAAGVLVGAIVGRRDSSYGVPSLGFMSQTAVVRNGPQHTCGVRM